jgi:hypothetical protein
MIEGFLLPMEHRCQKKEDECQVKGLAHKGMYFGLNELRFLL